MGSGTETTGARRVYAYDNIGNRDTYTKGTGAQTTYETNALNQYENVETASSPVTGQNMLYDADGNVTKSYVVGDFDGDGSVGFSDLVIFSSSYGYCEGDPEFDERTNLVTGDDPECIDAADQSAFMSLFGLSATSVMRAQMLWDAENRLAAYVPLNQSGGAKKVTFKYDYRGRRVEKNVYAWNSGAGAWYGDAYPTERRRFVWNGWLMLRETIESDLNSDGDLNDQDEGTRVKTYTWGKDLGGGLESAGSIGGLLAVYDDSATSGSTGDDLAYVYMYDANGNVGQLCDLSQSTATASIVAKYEYDAYGNATISTGSYATANTYRFSTKPWDDENGLGYWGYRYYDPRLGRWMSRDPIGENGIRASMENNGSLDSLIVALVLERYATRRQITHHFLLVQPEINVTVALLNAPTLQLDPTGLACCSRFYSPTCFGSSPPVVPGTFCAPIGAVICGTVGHCWCGITGRPCPPCTPGGTGVSSCWQCRKCTGIVGNGWWGFTSISTGTAPCVP